MAGKAVFTTKEIIEALQEADGYVSKAASLLGCSVMTLYNYRDRHPTVREAWQDIKERRHDFVENSLHKLIRDLNPAAVIFYLKTQCKDRGYVERQEVTGSDGGPVAISTIEIVRPREPDGDPDISS